LKTGNSEAKIKAAAYLYVRRKRINHIYLINTSTKR
jgi:hypothetical protein